VSNGFIYASQMRLTHAIQGYDSEKVLYQTGMTYAQVSAEKSIDRASILGDILPPSLEPPLKESAIRCVFCSRRFEGCRPDSNRKAWKQHMSIVHGIKAFDREKTRERGCFNALPEQFRSKTKVSELGRGQVARVGCSSKLAAGQHIAQDRSVEGLLSSYHCQAEFALHFM
jgi:hypothetical protein